MLELISGLAIVGGAVLGPVAWRAWRDWLEERALELRGRIQTVVDQRLGGESLLSVVVRPRTPWRAGRVVLLAPSDWQWLIDEVWTLVRDRLPAGYELVVTAPERSTAVRGSGSAALPQAA
jgi:hypothetical protein